MLIYRVAEIAANWPEKALIWEIRAKTAKLDARSAVQFLHILKVV